MKLEKRVRAQIVIRGRFLVEEGEERLLLSFFSSMPAPDDRIAHLSFELRRNKATQWTWGHPRSRIRLLGDLESALEDIRSYFRMNESLRDRQFLIDRAPWCGAVTTAHPELLQLFSYIRGFIEALFNKVGQKDRRDGLKVLDNRLLAYIIEQNKRIFEPQGIQPLK